VHQQLDAHGVRQRDVGNTIAVQVADGHPVGAAGIQADGTCKYAGRGLQKQ
jgi:hypothetical protein